MRTEVCAMKVKQSVLYTHKNIIQDSYFMGLGVTMVYYIIRCQESLHCLVGAEVSNMHEHGQHVLSRCLRSMVCSPG